jgi:hypothetical protein
MAVSNIIAAQVQCYTRQLTKDYTTVPVESTANLPFVTDVRSSEYLRVPHCSRREIHQSLVRYGRPLHNTKLRRHTLASRHRPTSFQRPPNSWYQIRHRGTNQRLRHWRGNKETKYGTSHALRSYQEARQSVHCQ